MYDDGGGGGGGDEGDWKATTKAKVEQTKNINEFVLS